MEIDNGNQLDENDNEASPLANSESQSVSPNRHDHAARLACQRGQYVVRSLPGADSSILGG